MNDRFRKAVSEAVVQELPAAMDESDYAAATHSSGNPCWGVWRRKLPINGPYETDRDTFDTVVGDYDPESDIVTFRNRRTWRRASLRRDFFMERFTRVPVARYQGNHG